MCKDDAADACGSLYPDDDEMMTNLATGDTSEKDAISRVLDEGDINEPLWIGTIKKLNEDKKMMLYKFGSHGLRVEDADSEQRKKRAPRQALVTRTLYKHKVKKRQTKRQVEVNSVEVEAFSECDDNGMMIPNMDVHYPWIETWENGTPCVDTSSCQARVCNVTTGKMLLNTIKKSNIGKIYLTKWSDNLLQIGRTLRNRKPSNLSNIGPGFKKFRSESQ